MMSWANLVAARSGGGWRWLGFAQQTGKKQAAEQAERQRPCSAEGGELLVDLDLGGDGNHPVERPQEWHRQRLPGPAGQAAPQDEPLGKPKRQAGDSALDSELSNTSLIPNQRRTNGQADGVGD